MSNWIRIESKFAATPLKPDEPATMDVNLDHAYFNFPHDEGDGIPAGVVAQIVMANGMCINVTKLPEEWKRFGRKD